MIGSKYACPRWKCTASGRLMFQIIGAMAGFERALIQERVRAGLRDARAKGKWLGRPSRNVDALGSQRCTVREQAGVRFLLN